MGAVTVDTTGPEQGNTGAPEMVTQHSGVGGIPGELSEQDDIPKREQPLQDGEPHTNNSQQTVAEPDAEPLPLTPTSIARTSSIFSTDVDDEEDFEDDFGGYEPTTPRGDTIIEPIPPLSLSSPPGLKSAILNRSSVQSSGDLSGSKKRVLFKENVDVISYEAPAMGSYAESETSGMHWESSTLPRGGEHSRMRRRLLGQRRDTFDLVHPPKSMLALNHQDSTAILRKARLGQRLKEQQEEDESFSASETRPRSSRDKKSTSCACVIL